MRRRVAFGARCAHIIKPHTLVFPQHEHQSSAGLDLKIVEDPVGFFTAAVAAASRAWQLLMRLLGPAPPVEGLVPAPVVAGVGAAGAGRGSQYQGGKHD